MLSLMLISNTPNQNNIARIPHTLTKKVQKKYNSLLTFIYKCRTVNYS